MAVKVTADSLFNEFTCLVEKAKKNLIVGFEDDAYQAFLEGVESKVADILVELRPESEDEDGTQHWDDDEEDEDDV